MSVSLIDGHIDDDEVFDVYCENCGHYEEKPDDVSKTRFIKEMRQKGWRVGEPTFCPACAAAVKGQRGVTPMEGR